MGDREQAETIVLPRSGLVLERSAERGTHWRRHLGALCVEVRDSGVDDHPMYPRWSCSTGGGWCFYRGRDAMIVALEDSILETRAALLGGNVRERIARALMDEDGVADESRDELRATYRARADAVLDAIRGEG